MGKIINRTTPVIFLCLALFTTALILLMRTYTQEKHIKADVFPLQVAPGEQITFTDSTRGAKQWTWEFGNGDRREAQAGVYRFSEAGTYQIRLRIDNIGEKYFTVSVKPVAATDHADMLLIRIAAPDTAIQGENIVFTGMGNDGEWRWEFGETGRVDSRDKIPIYAYSTPGRYQVRLSTENTQYPITHNIEILPGYTEDNGSDPMTAAALDIQGKLQAIADGKPFNVNYNHILNTYLCSNPEVMVTVNSDKRNDFYSYCQGLRITGKNRTVIENVFVEADSPDSKCITVFMVMQSDRR
jgi:hypothetical protein